MRKIIIVLFLIFNYSFSDQSILNVVDNGDNTITITGKFDLNQNTTNALVRIESLTNKKIIFSQKLSNNRKITIDIPKESYQIVLDEGNGHQYIKKGIPPKEGFSKTKTKQKTPIKKNGSNLAYFVSLFGALFFMVLTMYFCYWNTNRLVDISNIK